MLSSATSSSCNPVIVWTLLKLWSKSEDTKYHQSGSEVWVFNPAPKQLSKQKGCSQSLWDFNTVMNWQNVFVLDSPLVLLLYNFMLIKHLKPIQIGIGLEKTDVCKGYLEENTFVTADIQQTCPFSMCWNNLLKKKETNLKGKINLNPCSWKIHVKKVSSFPRHTSDY